MNNIFEKFDKQINLNELKEQVANANNNNTTDYPEVPAGSYITKIERMELGTTKDGRPMFKVQMRLIEGNDYETTEFLEKYTKNKPCIFMNRVIFGTKNDGNMISSVIGWLKNLGCETPIVFEGYEAFADLILDLAEECQNIELEVDYDPEAFNSITINEVYDA